MSSTHGPATQAAASLTALLVGCGVLGCESSQRAFASHDAGTEATSDAGSGASGTNTKGQDPPDAAKTSKASELGEPSPNEPDAGEPAPDEPEAPNEPEATDTEATDTEATDTEATDTEEPGAGPGDAGEGSPDEGAPHAADGGFQEPESSPADSGGSSSPDCMEDTDCAAPATEPPDCAVASCWRGACVYAAVDFDNDGEPTRDCMGTEVEVEVGRDCNDDDDAINPDAWDGPDDDEHPNACGDGIDNDCSGTPDDGVLDDGSSCVCSPGDSIDCSVTTSEVEITYPKLDALGVPLGNCRLGTRTCDSRGQWGLCLGAVGPSPEVCDQVDNDCNGVADDNASDTRTFWYDADGDLHAPVWATSVVACFAPSSAPAGCSSEQALCPAAAWGTTAIQSDDCDDTDGSRYPGAPELCNRIDDDCSNTNESDAEPLEDMDGDGFTDENYTGCSGGYPRTDCFDENPDVRPDQTERFEEGYCLNSNTTYWCFTEGQCAAVDTCADSIGQIWGPGSLDYNCDGIEEPFTVAGTDVVPLSEACAAAPPSTCEASGAPPYAISANANCGGIDDHQVCQSDGAGCSYSSSFLITACR